MIFEYNVDNGTIIKLSVLLDCGSSCAKIDWGDGDNTLDAAHHEYRKRGNCRVKIYNFNSKAFNFNYSCQDGIAKFITIGRIGITSLHCMFYNSLFNGVIEPN